MKFTELKTKLKPELQSMLLEQGEKLRKLRFELVAGKVKNVRELRNTKKIIAQIKTLCQKSN